MFTGLIQDKGRVSAADWASGRLIVQTKLAPALTLGASVAVNGACLTVVEKTESEFQAQVSQETLARTNFSQLKAGDAVNCEPALRVGDPLGGHFVLGHIDATAKISELEEVSSGDGKYLRLRMQYPKNLSSYFIEKGSVAIDGVSLTINTLLRDDQIEVMIVPHTLSHTVIGEYRVGSVVNLEVDMLGKYVKRILQRTETP